MDSIADRFPVRLGYSFHHLTTNERLDRFGDAMFPTDSTVKIAIMGAGMEKSGFFQNYNAGAEIEFTEAKHQMITVSDNTATLMLLRWVGGIGVVDDWLDRPGADDHPPDRAMATRRKTQGG